MLRRARPHDVDATRAVGVAAGQRFRALDDPRVAERADDPPFEPGDGTRLWVATDGYEVVGFVAVEVVGRGAHVEEVSVHPDHGGRGHGTALLDEVARWAALEGLDAITLTTFVDVPWNRPFYERRGFRVLGEHELTPELRDVRDHEATLGLDPAIRVVMRRELPGGAG